MKDELLNALLFGAKKESLNNVLQDLKEAVWAPFFAPVMFWNPGMTCLPFHVGCEKDGKDLRGRNCGHPETYRAAHPPCRAGPPLSAQ